MPFFRIELIIQGLHDMLTNFRQVGDGLDGMVFDDDLEGAEESKFESLIVLPVGQVAEQ